MLNNISSDLKRRIAVECDKQNFTDKLSEFLSRGMLAVIVYRYGRYANSIRIKPIQLALKIIYYFAFYFVQMFTQVSIQAYTKIGSGFVVRNFSSIFVLAESIGDNFTVCDGVTIGNVRGQGLPIIGNDVYLEHGCKVLGRVTIGNNVIVRANSLVLSDVPDNSIVLGNPGRITPKESG